MATLGVYAVLDKGAECYSRPLVYATDAVAIRALRDEVANVQSEYRKHSQDFSLYCLGSYDDGAGSFELYPEPRFVIAATSCIPEGE